MRADGERYGVDGDATKIIPLVRQAVELGINRPNSLPCFESINLIDVILAHHTYTHTQGPTSSKPIPRQTWRNTTKVRNNW
jgi:hypothetical protein